MDGQAAAPLLCRGQWPAKYLGNYSEKRWWHCLGNCYVWLNKNRNWNFCIYLHVLHSFRVRSLVDMFYAVFLNMRSEVPPIFTEQTIATKFAKTKATAKSWPCFFSFFFFLFKKSDSWAWSMRQYPTKRCEGDIFRRIMGIYEVLHAALWQDGIINDTDKVSEIKEGIIRNHISGDWCFNYNS